MTMKLKSPISVFKKNAFECLIIHIYVVCQSRCYTKPDNEIQLTSLLLHNTKLVPMTFDVAMPRFGSNKSNLFTQYN